MNPPNDEGQLLEQYIDALIQDIDAPVPPGLEPNLAHFARELILSQAVSRTKRAVAVSQAIPHVVKPVTQFRFPRRSRSYLTAAAAVIVVVFFAAILFAVAKPRSDPPYAATQPPSPQTATRSSVMQPTATPQASPVTTRIVTSAAAPICPEATGKTGPRIEPNSTADNSGTQTKFGERSAPQLLDYLNTVGSADGLAAQLNTLTGDPSLKAQVFTVDYTGDKLTEVLVFFPVMVDATRFVGGLFAFRCQDRRYVLNTGIDLQGFKLQAKTVPLQTVVVTNPQIEAIRDMNDDGIPEIVYASIGKLHDSGDWEETVTLFAWNGTQVATLATPVMNVVNGITEVRDVEGNGKPEIVIMAGTSLTATQPNAVQRPWEQTWGWNGSGLAFLCKRAAEQPIFRVQALADGDDNSDCGYYDKAMLLYQQAIFSSTLKEGAPGSSATPDAAKVPTMRQYQEAYARYRIILLHIMRQKFTEAQTDYDILQARYPAYMPGHEYAELAKAFWDAYQKNHNVGAACQQAISYAASNADVVFEPLTYERSDSADQLGSGSNMKEHPEFLCPFK